MYIFVRTTLFEEVCYLPSVGFRKDCENYEFRYDDGPSSPDPVKRTILHNDSKAYLCVFS